MPEETLLAFADHGAAPVALLRDGGDSEAALSAHAKAGVDLPALAERLQSGGAKSFVDSWRELLGAIDAKSKTLVLL
jgi:transaldolase